jgi:hypothetical protein
MELDVNTKIDQQSIYMFAVVAACVIAFTILLVRVSKK